MCMLGTSRPASLTSTPMILNQNAPTATWRRPGEIAIERGSGRVDWGNEAECARAHPPMVGATGGAVRLAINLRLTFHP